MKKLNGYHPLIFAIYPVLLLFSHNLGQYGINIIWLPLLLILSFSLLLWLALSLILKNFKKAGLIVSLSLVLFFSYGDVSAFLSNYSFYYFTISRYLKVKDPDDLLLPIYFLTFVVLFFSILLTRRDLKTITRLLDLTSLFLLLISLLSIGFYGIRRLASGQDLVVKNEEGKPALKLTPEQLANLPNVYYIILDGYTGNGVLKSIYNYDNNEFMEFLSAQGFYVARESHSNYMLTDLSLASSLNINYLDQMISPIDANSMDFLPLRKLMQHNSLMRLFKEQGYQLVCLSSGYYPTEIKSADIYIPYLFSLNEFQNALIDATPILRFVHKLSLLLPTQSQLHAESILFVFDTLGQLPPVSAPMFVFVHIIIPHPPFVFNSKGETLALNKPFSIADGNQTGQQKQNNEDEYAAYIRGYRNQVIFVNTKMKTVIENILSNSTRPAIIVLQGDHGSASFATMAGYNINYQERSSILNAYYFPDKNYSRLYSEISPVNTWRLIFNQYFAAHYEILPDQSYFSWYDRPYQFKDVTDLIKGNLRPFPNLLRSNMTHTK